MRKISKEVFLNKEKVSLLNPLSVSDLSTIPLIFFILRYLPKSTTSPYIYIYI